jgi:hypothetical protein
MTPLAHHLVKQLLVRKSKQEFDDQADVMASMSDIHCFELSEVQNMAFDLGIDAACKGVDLVQSSFLPAPKTWIEWQTPLGREAYLLSQQRPRDIIWVIGCGRFGSRHMGYLCWDDLGPKFTNLELGLCKIGEPASIEMSATLCGALAMINTPRVIGRRQHMPHRGLERGLLKAKPAVGMFPLRGWTELKLEAFYQRRDETGRLHEAHLTGEKCRHFCRAHLRIKLGQVEFVGAHWRGNAALGIKQTRYRLTAPRAAGQA